MNIFHAQFSTGLVVQATGVSNATLQSWIKRNILVAQKPDEAGSDLAIRGGGSPGLHRRFSFFNVMEIAVAKALIDVGLELDHAFKASRNFAHTGTGEISPDRPARVPSCPYDNAGMAAATLIAVCGPVSIEVLWKVGTDVLPIIWGNLQTQQGFVLIKADGVFKKVVSSLGYDPASVMALAYGRDDNQ